MARRFSIGGRTLAPDIGRQRRSTQPRSAIWLRLAAAAAALAVAPVSSAATHVDRGHAIVLRDCAGCHAVESRGDSPLPEAPRFRELHLRYPVDSLSEALAEGLMTGHPRMPEFRYSPREAEDIIMYLRSIQSRQGAALGRPHSSSR